MTLLQILDKVESKENEYSKIVNLPLFIKDGDIYIPVTKVEVKKLGYDISEVLAIVIE